MSNEKLLRRDNLIAIREALAVNGAADLIPHIDVLLRQEPVIKGNQHRGDSIHDGHAMTLTPQTSQQILDVLAVIPELQGQGALYGGKQISLLLNEFKRCVR